MRFFVEFAYNGTHFHGSQRQLDAASVQETMEQAFTTILRQTVNLTFAGRTDAGVHAEQMFAHFDLNNHIPSNLQTFTNSLNSLLPTDIAVKRIFHVDEQLHARFSALERTYEYRVTTRKNPFRQNLVTRVPPGLNYEAMNNAAQLLLGTHDFTSFCKVHTDVKTTLCTVTRADWTTSNTATTSNGDAVFTISADRFLRNMVRAVVGTLLEVGRGKMTVEHFQNIINAHNRCAAGQSAPPYGLFLTHIRYA